MAVVELMIIRTDAPALYTALATGTVPFVPISVTAGLASVRLLAVRAFLLVRLSAALTVTAVIWGWGAAHYPELLPGLTATEAAGDPAVPQSCLGALAVGGALLVPSLPWLFLIFTSDRAGTRPASRVPHS